MPVKSPETKTIPKVGIASSSSSSSPWNFNRNFLISPFDPNCKAT